MSDAPQRILEPLPDDPMLAAENEMRTETIRQAKDAVLKLAAVMEGTPQAATRALHLIGETAAVYGELLAAVGVPGVGRKRNHGIVGMYAAGSGLASGSDMSPGGETFGNQVLQQIVGVIKQVTGGLDGQKKPKKKSATTYDVESLVRAYANAKRDELEPEILAVLKSKIEEAMAELEFEDDPTAVPRAALDPAGAQFAAGVAQGIAAGAGLPITDEEPDAPAPAPIPSMEEESP